jgi:uncharacterized membrane protein YphA (DoxX/SURF4 family)
MNILLWILQVLLALLFLFAGGSKLIMSTEALSQALANQVMPSVSFIRFIGVCEFLGGLGLVLPGLLKTRQYLTPLAALGLAIIMIGAVVFTIINGHIPAAIFNFVLVLLLLFIAYARWRVVAHARRLIEQTN